MGNRKKKLEILIASVRLVACEDEGGRQYAVDRTGWTTTVCGWRDDRPGEQPGEQVPRERKYLKTIISAGKRTHGVIAVRPFDEGTAEQTLAKDSKNAPALWRVMWQAFHASNQGHMKYMRRYHRRSNVETVFRIVREMFADMGFISSLRPDKGVAK